MTLSHYPARFILSSTIALTTFVHFTRAQAPQTAPTTLPTVEVTATPESPSLTVPSVEQARLELGQTPGGTSVIPAEEYKRGRAINLKDALDFAPGVFIQPRFGAEESRISIRGSGIQRTFHGRGIKLLQDDVPLNLADGSFDFQAIEPLSAQYVEVFRGANALEYGSTTLGGAVNFISLTGHNSPFAQARLTLGSFDTIQGQISSGGVRGAFDYYVSLSHSSQNGFREHSQQNTQRLFANLGYRLSPEWETRFYITYVQTDSELPGSLTKAQLERDPTEPQRNPFFVPVDVVRSNWRRDFELFRIANKTTYQSGDHRLSLSTFWSHKDLDHPILFWIDQLSNDFGVNLRYDNTSELFGHQNQFTMGFAPTWGVVEDNRFVNNLGNRGAKFADSHQTAVNLDFYLQNRFQITPQLGLVLGAQATYASRENQDDFPTSALDPDNSDKQEWWGFSPKVGFLWDITPEAKAFLNVSRSFEPPSFGELVNATGGGLIELEEQTATTVEIGTRGKKGRFAWDVAYYYSWLEDELLGFEVAPGVSQTMNAGRTVHQGVEAALDVELWNGIFVREADAPVSYAKDGKTVVPGKEAKLDRLVLRQVYLWNDFRFDGDETFGDNRLAGIPEHYYRAELMYEHPCGFYAGPNVEWVPRSYNVDLAESLFADPYVLLGFKAGYRSERGFSVFVEAKNLTDRQYAATTNVIVDAGGLDGAQFFPGDGRSFYAGIEWKW
jgi:iron complex outermembrane receptor protein